MKRTPYKLCIFVVLVLTSGNANLADETSTETNVESTNDRKPATLATSSVDEATTELELSTLSATTLEESAAHFEEGRSIAQNYEVMDVHDEIDAADLRKEYSNLKRNNIFRSIYKNYKSTYMGNGTAADYKKRLRQRLSAITVATDTAASKGGTTVSDQITKKSVAHEEAHNMTESTVLRLKVGVPEAEILHKHKLKEKQRKRKRKYQQHTRVKNAEKPTNQLNQVVKVIEDNVANMTFNDTNTYDNNSFGGPNKHYRYNLGPGVNMSFDMFNEIVNVKLDGNNLREIMRGRWLSDNTEEGRGKKYDMMTKVLPLFVLPFLIQSAIVPFLVTKLKLLLMKSILVGKLAIFLLIISAIKNGNKMVQSYEVAPSYWAGEPSRRSELAAAASSTAYNGYRVEGKPAAWIN